MQMSLIMVTVSALLFAIFDSDQFRKSVAVAELGGFGVATSSDSDYQDWLTRKGLNAPFLSRYARWLENWRMAIWDSRSRRTSRYRPCSRRA